MAKKTTKAIQFDLSATVDIDESRQPEQECTQKKKKFSKFSLFKRSPSDNSVSSLDNNNKSKTTDVNEKKQKTKLVRYLSTEKPIVKKRVEIDTEERQLLDSLSDTVIDLDRYLQMPEPKVKDKLWRIPYYFRDTSVESTTEDGQKSINRFGDGVGDGCFVSLSLPLRKDKVDKNWEDILKQADEALEQYEHAQWSRASVTRARRGSILQPRHVFLTPNPELGNSEKFLLIGHSLLLRDCTSELFLYQDENALLEENYKQNIILNTSLGDLSNMLFPDLKSNMSNYSALTNSEIQYIKTVRNRRRQSLVPPNFEGQSDLRFRRQSFAGGELWSAKVEKERKRDNYHERLKLINPLFLHTPRQKSELEMAMEANQAAHYNSLDVSHFPHFDYNSTEQARLFAHELTLIVRQHFIAIKESEIVNFITHSGPHVMNSCANIKGLFHLQNRIIRLIATTILRHEDLNKRAESILFFIQVIRQLELLGNWHSINMLTQSLQCPPIVRLKDTWRKITFNYADEYCFFIQVSEDLAVGKQLGLYDSLTTFIAIFDDVVDKIKERCGFKIVQIHQFRLHKNWEKDSKSDNMVAWVNNEIMDLLKDINGNLEEKFFETNNLGKKSSITSIDMPVEKKPGFFQRLFQSKSTKPTRNNVLSSAPAVDTEDAVDESEQSGNVYQRRLLPGQIITRPVNLNSKVPSTKKFWSISEFNKLANKDKEQVKQEIVRTLVAFQKKTFCVFEERDGEIKDFLLNSQCDSMDACMIKSRSVEGDAKKEKELNQKENGDQRSREQSPVNGIITIRAEMEADKTDSVDPESSSTVEPRPHRTRRVMFAQDLNDESD